MLFRINMKIASKISVGFFIVLVLTTVVATPKNQKVP